METFESPVDRLKTVTLGLATDQSGPNVVAGVHITAVLQVIAGFAPEWWAYLTFIAWAGTIFIYSVADEIRVQIEEQKNRLLDPLDDRPRGIE